MLHNGKFYGILERKKEFKRAIRVNLSGELGALWLYDAQIQILKDPQTTKELLEMKEHEIVHLNFFIEKRKESMVRPSFFNPIFRLLGKSISTASSLIGKNYAMALTESVEEVITFHYQNQANFFKKHNPDFSKTILKFAAEEENHRQEAQKYSHVNPAFKNAIKLGTKIAIKIANFF